MSHEQEIRNVIDQMFDEGRSTTDRLDELRTTHSHLFPALEREIKKVQVIRAGISRAEDVKQLKNGSTSRRKGLGGETSRGNSREIHRRSTSNTPENFTAEFGKYKLLHQLGNGSFGSVWKAFDTILCRWVAVKIPIVEGSKQEFIDEARITASLAHPNIATIYDVDEIDETVFIAMEYVSGRSLFELRANNFSEQQIAEIGFGIAKGLVCAHQQGIVHRDLKLSNILIDEMGKPVIVDFGLATKLRGSDVHSNEVCGDTDGGQDVRDGREIVGTRVYMAPEQKVGRAEPRSDIYSLGVILNRLLTGARPSIVDTDRANAGETPNDGLSWNSTRSVSTNSSERQKPSERRKPSTADHTDSETLTNEICSHEICSHVSEDLAAILAACLKPNPEHRYSSAEELARDLSRFLAGEPTAIRPPSLFRKSKGLLRKRKVESVVIFALLAIVGSSLVASSKSKSKLKLAAVAIGLMGRDPSREAASKILNVDLKENPRTALENLGDIPDSRIGFAGQLATKHLTLGRKTYVHDHRQKTNFFDLMDHSVTSFKFVPFATLADRNGFELLSFDDQFRRERFDLPVNSAKMVELRSVAFVDSGGKLFVMNLDTHDKVSLGELQGPLVDIHLADSKYIVCTSQYISIRTPSGPSVETWRPPVGTTIALAHSVHVPRCLRTVICLSDGTLLLVDSKNGDVKSNSDLSGEPRGLLVSEDGKRVAIRLPTEVVLCDLSAKRGTILQKGRFSANATAMAFDGTHYGPEIAVAVDGAVEIRNSKQGHRRLRLLTNGKMRLLMMVKQNHLLGLREDGELFRWSVE